uniref:FHA domain-containing protein n=1 Tax=Syphacia muris TaxID=451379 RepID=A0A0N5AJN0_9BILA
MLTANEVRNSRILNIFTKADDDLRHGFSNGTAADREKSIPMQRTGSYVSDGHIRLEIGKSVEEKRYVLSD